MAVSQPVCLFFWSLALLISVSVICSVVGLLASFLVGPGAELKTHEHQSSYKPLEAGEGEPRQPNEAD